MRIKNIILKLKEKNLDAFIVTHPANLSYLTEYASRDSYLLVSKNGFFYLTDSRYTEEAKLKLNKAIKVKKTDKSFFKTLADICAELKVKCIGFEERNLSLLGYQNLKKYLNKKTKIIPTQNVIEELREIKSSQEIEKIKKAVKITGMALEFAKKIVSPGRKEIEIVGELERFIRYHGATGPSFDIIVASGPNSSFPHHLPTQRKIRSNEPVLIDIGVDYQGYKSDLTRVFFMGKINILTQRVYAIVLEAQTRAIQYIKAGAKTDKADALARDFIKQEGYGEYFDHNLGHGIGLEVHESPRLTAKESLALKAGMVLTVEPGIYLPNKFGIRIEDNVLVTKKGCEVLSGAINK